MTDHERDFIIKMARFVVPGDDNGDMKTRVAEISDMYGLPARELYDEDIASSTDDDFLIGEVLAFWSMVREARELVNGGASC